MGTYLLIWNPTKSIWDDYPEYQEAVELGLEARIRWSCGVRKHLTVGSRIFMMRLGYRQPIHGIFASGFTTCEPYLADHWDKTSPEPSAQYVELRFDAMLNLEIHSLFDAETEISQAFKWRQQSSGVEIPISVAEALEAKWQAHLNTLGVTAISSRDSQKSLGTYQEGKLSRVTVNRYERDREARQKCIDHYGAVCCACEFSFAEFYGENLGRHFIHVHHLNPIASQGGEYRIDPINDLNPVCPNCHAMLHRETPPLSIEQLRKYIKEQRDLKG